MYHPRHCVGLVVAALMPALLLGGSAGAAPAGQPLAANQQNALDTVAFRTVQHGRLGGAHTILVTTDGGRTWTRQYSGPSTVRQFSFVSDSAGWAMGRGSLLRTTNAGRNWSVVHKPPHALQQIDFVTSSRGWAIAGNRPDQMALYRTNDAGTTWTSQSLSMPVGAVCFSDPAHGWAARAFSTGKTAVAIVATGDGGTTWRPVAVPPGAGDIGGFVGQKLSCPTANTVWDLVTFGGYAGGAAYALYRGTAGGTQWKAVAQVMAPGHSGAPRGPGTAPGDLAAPSGQVAYLAGMCFACGGQGTTSVGETLDGGKTWRNLGIPGLPTSTAALSFPASHEGWLVANWQTSAAKQQSAVFKTTDGGIIWQRQIPAPQGMVSVTFTLTLYGYVPDGQEFAVAGPPELGGGSGALPICTTIAARLKLGLVPCVGNRTVYARNILVPRGSTFDFYFERFTPQHTVAPLILYSGTRTANKDLTVGAYIRFG